MRRSRLEKYLSILEALALQPVGLEEMSYASNIECRMLKRHLGFLISLHLVERRTVRKGISYSLSPRGLMVLKALRAQERIEKLKKVLPLKTRRARIFGVETNTSG